MLSDILNTAAAYSASMHGRTDILPYVILAIVWESLYVLGLLAFTGLSTALKMIWAYYWTR